MFKESKFLKVRILISAIIFEYLFDGNILVFNDIIICIFNLESFDHSVNYKQTSQEQSKLKVNWKKIIKIGSKDSIIHQINDWKWHIQKNERNKKVM